MKKNHHSLKIPVFGWLGAGWLCLILLAGCGTEGESSAGDSAATPALADQTRFQVAALYNNEALQLRFRFFTDQPSWYHQYWIYEDGEWTRYGAGSKGPDPDGLYEDRISVLWDDGSVDGFATMGGYVTVHEGMRSTATEIDAAEVESHPYLGETLGQNDVRKFIRESRRDDFDDEPLWSAVRDEQALRELQEQGVFLDLWQWRSHRSHPMGYADNGYVLDYRHSSSGRSTYQTNQNSESGLPEWMFNPETTGQRALRLEKLQQQAYGQEDFYYLYEDIAVPFDPDYEWENGDALPQRFLREPEGSRGAIRAAGSYKDGAWRIRLTRSLESPNPLDSKTFESGEIYHAAFAVHTESTGARHHLVSLPVSVGLGVVEADIIAQYVEGNLDQADAEWVTIGLFDPGDPTQ